MPNDTGSVKKVLIIEDEKAIAKATEIKLMKSGIEAKAVYSGAAGLEELQKNQYNLVLLDIMMPEIDGWQVLNHMKESGMSTPVIVLSNLSQEEDKQRAAQLGATDFLVKADTTLASIVQRVQRALQSESQLSVAQLIT